MPKRKSKRVTILKKNKSTENTESHEDITEADTERIDQLEDSNISNEDDCGEKGDEIDGGRVNEIDGGRVNEIDGGRGNEIDGGRGNELDHEFGIGDENTISISVSEDSILSKNNIKNTLPSETDENEKDDISKGVEVEKNEVSKVNEIVDKDEIDNNNGIYLSKDNEVNHVNSGKGRNEDNRFDSDSNKDYNNTNATSHVNTNDNKSEIKEIDIINTNKEINLVTNNNMTFHEKDDIGNNDNDYIKDEEREEFANKEIKESENKECEIYREEQNIGENEEVEVNIEKIDGNQKADGKNDENVNIYKIDDEINCDNDGVDNGDSIHNTKEEINVGENVEQNVEIDGEDTREEGISRDHCIVDNSANSEVVADDINEKFDANKESDYVEKLFRDSDNMKENRAENAKKDEKDCGGLESEGTKCDDAKSNEEEVVGKLKRDGGNDEGRSDEGCQVKESVDCSEVSKVEMLPNEEHLLVTWKNTKLKVPCFHETNKDLKYYTRQLTIIAYPIIISDLYYPSLSKALATAIDVSMKIGEVPDGGVRRGYLKMKFKTLPQVESATEALKSLPPFEAAATDGGGNTQDVEAGNTGCDSSQHDYKTKERFINVWPFLAGNCEDQVMENIRGPLLEFDFSIHCLLFISNLKLVTTESDILEEFKGCERIIMPLDDKKTKGHAYVEYLTKHDARRALEKFKESSKRVDEWFAIPAICQERYQLGLLNEKDRKYWLGQITNLETALKNADAVKNREYSEKRLFEYKRKVMRDNKKRNSLGFSVPRNEVFEDVLKTDEGDDGKKMDAGRIHKSEVGKRSSERNSDRYLKYKQRTNEDAAQSRRTSHDRVMTPIRRPSHARKLSPPRYNPPRRQHFSPVPDRYFGRRTAKNPDNQLVDRLKNLIGALPSEKILELNEELISGSRSSSRVSRNISKRIGDYDAIRRIEGYNDSNESWGYETKRIGHSERYEVGQARKRRYDDDDDLPTTTLYPSYRDEVKRKNDEGFHLNYK